jgi:uncharacterized protein (DUF427 family)
VWDYPRPPRLERSTRHVVVEFAGVTVAETRRALRVCETSGPPVYYVPPEDVRLDLLLPVAETTECEWKGTASYFDLIVGDRRATRAAWTYARPLARYRELEQCIAFFPGRVEGCYLDGERVLAQDGDYYGGWITREIVGPYKGAPGTQHW